MPVFRSRKLITRPGLEESASDTGKTPDSEIGGHSGGQFGFQSETVAGLKVQAPADPTRALASFQKWQETSGRREADAITAELMVPLNRVRAQYESRGC